MPIFLETKVSYRCPKPEQFSLGQNYWDVNCDMDAKQSPNVSVFKKYWDVNCDMDAKQSPSFRLQKARKNGWAKNATARYARRL